MKSTYLILEFRASIYHHIPYTQPFPAAGCWNLFLSLWSFSQPLEPYFLGIANLLTLWVEELFLLQNSSWMELPPIVIDTQH